MVVERRSRTERAAVLAALGDVHRLAVVERLVPGDASPGTLAEELAIGSNLLAHHLRVLEEAGVLERVRSEGDRRRSYVRLRPAALDGLVAGRELSAPRVLFVCTHNSARSQLAAATWRRISRVPASSAGTRPARRVHPRAVRVGRRHGVSLLGVAPAPLAQVLRPDDLVVAVCDNAHEELTVAGTGHLHWSVPDPARVDTDAAFEHAFDLIEDRVGRLAETVRPTPTTSQEGTP